MPHPRVIFARRSQARSRLLAALAAALTAAAPAQADIRRGPRVIECYCTGTQGERHELGETICLHVDGRSFTAQCQMSLNVPMWRELAEGCANAALPVRPLPYASGPATPVPRG